MAVKYPCEKCGLKEKRNAGGLCNRCFRREGRGRGESGGKGEGNAPAQLRFMRRAWNWKGGEPKSAQLKFYVDLKETNPGAFSAQLERLEKEYRAMKAGVAPGGVDNPNSDACDPDESATRVLAMIDRLLKLGTEAASQ